MESTVLAELFDRHHADADSVYNTWFVGEEERLRAFRSIRRGVRDTVGNIVAGIFGNDFKGSPPEVVLTGITEGRTASHRTRRSTSLMCEPDVGKV